MLRDDAHNKLQMLEAVTGEQSPKGGLETRGLDDESQARQAGETCELDVVSCWESGVIVS
jgi:hypothetical protein